MIGLEDRFASGRHLRLEREGEGWHAVDEGSTNGTRINGRLLAPGERRALPDGALLEVGHTFLLFRATAQGRGDLAETMEPRGGAPREPSTLNPEWELELAKVSRLARTQHEILLEGESGAGKEVLARLIHELSGRTGPLVALNCSALSESLLNDELFGHVRGAFSGAEGQRPGLLRSAHRGTLFLDEVGDMPLSFQAKLLRVLEDGRVRPIGAEAEVEVEVDVRFLAATHRDLRACVASGEFRHDLFARLGMLSVRVPSVRERREDLGLLIRGALASFENVRFEVSALRSLLLYRWPLNVRELRTAIRAAAEMASPDERGDRVIAREHLPAHLQREPEADTPAVPPADLSAEDLSLRARISELLRVHRGNVAAVARALDQPRTRVQRLMARLAIKRPLPEGEPKA